MWKIPIKYMKSGLKSAEVMNVNIEADLRTTFYKYVEKKIAD